jgi:hypothetical protein
VHVGVVSFTYNFNNKGRGIKLKTKLITFSLCIALVIAVASPIFAQEDKTENPAGDHHSRHAADAPRHPQVRRPIPDKGTVEKVYDNLEFQCGAQSFLTAMPGASLSTMRKAIRSLFPP